MVCAARTCPRNATREHAKQKKNTVHANQAHCCQEREGDKRGRERSSIQPEPKTGSTHTEGQRTHLFHRPNQFNMPRRSQKTQRLGLQKAGPFVEIPTWVISCALFPFLDVHDHCSLKRASKQMNTAGKHQAACPVELVISMAAHNPEVAWTSQVVNRFREVKKLLIDTTITAADLQALSALKNLRKLWIEHATALGPCSMRFISGMTGLQTLRLINAGDLTDKDLAYIAQLSGLEGLTLWGCPEITNKGLKHLNRLRNLRSLSLGCCGGVTAAGMLLLTDLHEMKELDIHFHLPESVVLTVLNNMPKLQELYCPHNSGLSQLQAKLQQSHPKLVVDLMWDTF